MQATATDYRPGVALLTLRGELDTDTAPTLHAALDELLARPQPRIVVDLTDLHFCDSIGLSAFLVGARHAANRGGWLRLAGPVTFVRQLLETVGLSGHLGVHADVAQAAAAD